MPSNASKTGLPEYSGGNESVYAAKITEITPFDVPNVPNLKECLKLFMGGIVKEANVIPQWIAANPDVAIGGYLVAKEVGGKVKLEYSNLSDFETKYALVEQVEAKE